MAILVLDGHNLLYRAFSILPRSITGSDDQPINGVYGLVTTILRLQREHDPSHIVIAFDVPDVQTFRHQLYPSYQGQRGPLGGEHADDFRRQTEIAYQGLPLIGVPVVSAAGYEADDVMGTLARTISRAGGAATLVSSDRDVLQLVGSGVDVVVPGPAGPHLRDGADVYRRLGVDPSGVTTFKALAGDASDNIPGVAGIGSKTAATLVNRFGTLEEIYAALDEMPRRTASMLRAQRKTAFLFRRLVTIVDDLDLPIAINSLPVPAINSASKVRDILSTMGH